METQIDKRGELRDCLASIFAGTPYVHAATGAIKVTALSEAAGFTPTVLSNHISSGRLSTGAAYRLLQLRRRHGWKASGWDLDRYVTYRGQAQPA